MVAILSFSFCLLFISCKNTPTEIVPTEKATAETVPTQLQGKDESVYTAEFDPETDFDNSLGWTFSSGRNIIETADAFYLLPLSSYIYYGDKATGEYAPLCAKPECLHDEEEFNPSCNAFVGRLSLLSVNYYNGKLYYAKYTNPDYTLYRMDLDGSNHEAVLQLSCDHTKYGIMNACIHRGRVYSSGFKDIVENGEPKQLSSVVCWDMQTGEFKVIFEEKNEYGGRLPMMFFYGKYVYICIESLRGRNVTPGVKILRWDTENELLEPVFDAGEEGISGDLFSCWVVSEDEIYLTALFSGAEHSEFYRISDGKITETFSFTKNGCAFMLDGAVLINGDIEGTDQRWAQIMSFDGKMLFDSNIPLDVLNSTMPASCDYDDIAFTSVHGDPEAFYFLYDCSRSRAGDARWLVRYDISSGTPEAAVVIFATEK